MSSRRALSRSPAAERGAGRGVPQSAPRPRPVPCDVCGGLSDVRELADLERAVAPDLAGWIVHVCAGCRRRFLRSAEREQQKPRPRSMRRERPAERRDPSVAPTAPRPIRDNERPRRLNEKPRTDREPAL